MLLIKKEFNFVMIEWQDKNENIRTKFGFL